MSHYASNLPPDQEAIREKCFHPTGRFVEFSKEEIEQSIAARFEKIVEMYPGRIAVKTKDHMLTYAALNETANRVAHAILFERGGRHEPVMLMLEHDVQLIVALLGVLKSGKFYVIVDPSHPPARNAYIAENNKPGLILASNETLSLATELAQSGCRVINIEKLDSSFSTENPNTSIFPDAFASCLYTSGSTGAPKGVVQTHRNGLHDTRLWTESFHICPDDRLTLLAFGTGQAIKNIYSAVLNGATLYPRDIKVEGLANLANWLIKEEITVYFSGAPLFRHFLETLTGQESFPKLRLIRLGSERVSKRDVVGYKKHFSEDCILVNALSSNEVGTFRQYYVDKESYIATNTVPVGYGVEDKEVLLLDDAGQEVSYTNIGEIAVKSRCLSPGYWPLAPGTQTGFQFDLGRCRAGVHRTGDLGRLLSNGCLEHLGRKDFQTKIRGYKIDVSEIEAVLLAVDTVKEVVVMGWEGRLQHESVAPGVSKRLVAYIVPASWPTPTVTRLRHVLSEKLPDYMIPANFVFLDSFPLTPSGKIDRRSLPEPETCRPQLDVPFVAPTTPVEVQLARIWAHVLGRDEVGIHDDFFDLGGHSLAAMRVVSRVLKTFQLGFPLQSLFAAPTIAEMAAVIAEHQRKQLHPRDLDRVLGELESLSEEEAQRLLCDAKVGDRP